MIPASSGMKRYPRYPKNGIPRRNLKEADSLKNKIKCNEINYAFAWDYRHQFDVSDSPSSASVHVLRV